MSLITEPHVAPAHQVMQITHPTPPVVLLVWPRVTWPRAFGVTEVTWVAGVSLALERLGAAQWVSAAGGLGTAACEAYRRMRGLEACTTSGYMVYQSIVLSVKNMTLIHTKRMSWVYNRECIDSHLYWWCNDEYYKHHTNIRRSVTFYSGVRRNIMHPIYAHSTSHCSYHVT